MAASTFDTRPIDVSRELPLPETEACPPAASVPLTATATWRFLRFLFFPLAAYSLVSRASMMRDKAALDGIFPVLDGWRSEPALYVALLGLFGVAASLARSPAQRRVAAVAATLTAATTALLVVTSLYFYQVTGSHVDWVLCHLFLTKLSETMNVASSEANGTILLHVAVPSVAALLALRARPWSAPLLPRADRLRHARAYGLAAIVGAVLSIAPSLTLEERDLFRNGPLNIAASLHGSLSEPISDARFDREALESARLVPAAPSRWKNVVVVIMESTGTRATTAYDPEMPTTPFLAELAKKSLVMERAYTVLPHTSKANVSILCGLEPHLRLSITEKVASPARCLPALLRDHGYASAYVIPVIHDFAGRDRQVVHWGFEDFIPMEEMGDTSQFEYAHYLGLEDAAALEPTREWLANNGHRPFFVTHMTSTPHHDYVAPKRYGRHDFDEDEIYNRYLNAIHYQDQFLKELFALYEEQGLYEETLFVLIGDHGEGFWEHGRMGHSNIPYEEGVAIPFLIHAPGAFEDGARVENLVSQLDVLPTVASMLGFALEQGQYSGQPVWEAEADRVHFFSCWMERECVGSVDARWKHIHHFGEQPDELFDLAADPLETRNLAADHPELTRVRRKAALEWRGAVNASYEAHLGLTGIARFVDAR